MTRPRIVSTSATRSPRRSASRGPAPARPRTRRVLPAVWGALFVLGGIAIWASLGRRSEPLPEVWKQTAQEERSVGALEAEVRPGGGRQGDLLRLEWPAHPSAKGYRVRFVTQDGYGPAPVTLSSTVFLYDLATNVLHLPEAFDWEVTAVLADGSEIVSPPRRYPD